MGSEMCIRDSSKARIADNLDFAFLREDMDRLKKQVDENAISLNINNRREENAKARARNKERNAQRRVAYSKIEEEEGDSLKLYKLTLDNVDDAGLTLAADFTDEENTGFRLGKDDEGDDDSEEENVDYPFDLDPMKREALRIVEDFIALTTTPKTASVQPADAPTEN